jgi:hypothetical protein
MRLEVFDVLGTVCVAISRSTFVKVVMSHDDPVKAATVSFWLHRLLKADQSAL